MKINETLVVNIFGYDWIKTYGTLKHQKQMEQIDYLSYVMSPKNQDSFLDAIRTRTLVTKYGKRSAIMMSNPRISDIQNILMVLLSNLVIYKNIILLSQGTIMKTYFMDSKNTISVDDSSKKLNELINCLSKELDFAIEFSNIDLGYLKQASSYNEIYSSKIENQNLTQSLQTAKPNQNLHHTREIIFFSTSKLVYNKSVYRNLGKHSLFSGIEDVIFEELNE